MTPSLTYDELRALKPCSDSLLRVTKLMGGAKKWDGKKIGAEQARKLGATFDDLIWAASALALKNPDVARRLRLWMTDCAARVLHIYEADYPNDDRPRNAIIAARKFARGKIDDAASDAASDAARAAASDAASAAARAAASDAASDAARAAASDAASAAARAAASDAARAAARAAASDAARAAASDAASAAARAAARAAASDAARAAEKEWQFDRLIEWLSTNEPDDYALPKKQKSLKTA